MIMLQCLLLVLTITASVCCLTTAELPNQSPGDDSPAQPKIVGGTDAFQGEYPYQVSLRKSGWNLNHICGGSVIDKDYVLTAAHCMQGVDVTDIQVVTGDILLDRSSCTSVRRRVSSIVVHEGFNSDTMENDIAIIKLSKSLPTDSEYIKRIQLPNETIPAGTRCTVTGWGVNKSGTEELQGTLQAVEVPFIPYSVCEPMYNNNIHKYLFPGMVCAGGENGKDSCQGDSGGPLQCDKKLVGIVSWGFGCALAGNPGVYTDVQFYYNWILSNMQAP